MYGLPFTQQLYFKFFNRYLIPNLSILWTTGKNTINCTSPPHFETNEKQKRNSNFACTGMPSGITGKIIAQNIAEAVIEEAHSLPRPLQGRGEIKKISQNKK